ncbi:glycosyltransferase family 1 protein [Hebeloma cylindrosporum]|uniref:Glycosyltransferase family 1 protein n=1 Tax=Hebeloma cylindrosporum TaxID=76867 RepID=A0A0C3CZS9_HEBCY|nr:glycosyltransferase family 1 protein [Hebeloma cylindrosporum h7]
MSSTATNELGKKSEERRPSATPINYSKYVAQGKGLDSSASINADGRISLHFDLKEGMPHMPPEHAQDVEEFGVDEKGWDVCPKMNIVIMIVGSRGDVQPYVALGQQLLKDGHRVRIATHETFNKFVTDAGLEFFSIGGSPQDLMSYMVKNPGLMPGIESLTNGDIVKKRKMLHEMINGCWFSCHSPCPVSGRSFAADAIISNPPAFAHIHCAEALGIPLLLSFTMPWSPTVAFPHPLVNITTSNAGFGTSNYLSYAAADLLTWQGVGDIINHFRTTKLGLSPLSVHSGAGYVDRLKIPWTYCMSPALVPKPDDWKNNIDVTGFYFLDLASTYQPPPELAAFLAAGEPPVYIGFGSVVVDDPVALSQMVFDATKQAGVRALVSSGWGGLGGASAPSHIHMLGNVPHDWLFDKDRVSAVVHHGGAGTTAIGLAKGRPTVVVPFFGDQGFWGNMIHKSGAGPQPIPHKELTTEKLRDAITFAISPIAKKAASDLAQKIHDENGVARGVDSFYKHLPLLNMRCALDPSRVAVWWSPEQCLKLSAFAAQTLADAKLISLRSLVLHRPKEYRSRKKVVESTAGGANAVFWSLTNQTKFGGMLNSAVAKADKGYVAAHGIFDAMQSIRASSSKQKVEGKERERGHEGAVYQAKNHKKEALAGAIKHLVQGKKPATPGLPVQGTWALTQSAYGKKVYDSQRMTRIAEGRDAVSFSTESQRAYIIERYKAEICETPTRQKMYHDALQVERMDSASSSVDSDSEGGAGSGSGPVLGRETSTFSSGQARLDDGTIKSPEDSSESISGLPSVSPPLVEAHHEEEDENAAFVREMELAMKLSLEEYEQMHPLLAKDD